MHIYELMIDNIANVHIICGNWIQENSNAHECRPDGFGQRPGRAR